MSNGVTFCDFFYKYNLKQVNYTRKNLNNKKNAKVIQGLW